MASNYIDKKAGSLPYEVPTSYSQNPLAGPCVEHRRFLCDRSRSCAGCSRLSSQLILWTCS